MEFEDLFKPHPGVFAVDGAKLKQARINRGLVAYKFAKMSGISQTFLCMVEKGQRAVSQKNAQKMYKVLSTAPKVKGLDL